MKNHPTPIPTITMQRALQNCTALLQQAYHWWEIADALKLGDDAKGHIKRKVVHRSAGGPMLEALKRLDGRWLVEQEEEQLHREMMAEHGREGECSPDCPICHAIEEQATEEGDIVREAVLRMGEGEELPEVEF